MKRNILFFVVILVLISVFNAAFAQEQLAEKPTAAVLKLDVKNITGVNSLILTEKAYAEMIKIDKFKLLTAQEAYQIFQTKKFNPVMSINTDYLIKAGKILGVDKIISGALFQEDNKVVLTVKMVNVKEEKAEKEIVKYIDDIKKLDKVFEAAFLKLCDEPVLGEITVNSNVAEAAVYCDEKECGKTPCTVNNAAMGQHKITIKKEGYKIFEATAELNEDNPAAEVKAELKKEFPRTADLNQDKIKEIWVRQESGIKNNLMGVFALNEKKVWVVARGGVILHTSDGGSTWAQQENPVKEDLNNIYFIDENLGWACGNKGTIIFTSDGGKTWSKANSGTGAPLYKCVFMNENEGWAIGGICSQNPMGVAGYAFGALGGLIVGLAEAKNMQDNGCIVLATQDGGKTWSRIKSAGLSGYFGRYDIYVDKDKNFITAGRHGIVYSYDKGATWKMQQLKNQNNKPISGSFHALYFMNENEGWIGGAEGSPDYEKGAAMGALLIFKTTDGGKNWERQNTPKINGTVREIYFLNKDYGWAVGSYESGENAPILLYTENGGGAWDKIDFPEKIVPMDVCFVNPNCGWLVGKNGVIYKYEYK